MAALAYYAGSDPIVELFYWIALVSAGVSVLLVFQILMLRFVFMLADRHNRRLQTRWRSLLVSSFSSAGRLSALGAHTARVILPLWNKMFESVYGEREREALREVACSIGLDRFALKRVKRISIRERLQAIRALGHLGTEEAWRVIDELTKSPVAIVSLTAAESLVRIDSERGLIRLLDLAETRSDWPRDRLAGMFHEIGADRLSYALASRMLRMPEEALGRLMRLMELMHEKDVLNVIRIRLRLSSNIDVIAGAIYLLGRIPCEFSLKTVRSYADHPSWVVRNQVAIALGRIGREQDHKILIRLTRDASRWVRFRAAQALVALPTVRLDELKQVLRQEDDVFAREILWQAIVEKESIR